MPAIKLIGQGGEFIADAEIAEGQPPVLEWKGRSFVFSMEQSETNHRTGVVTKLPDVYREVVPVSLNDGDVVEGG